MNSPLNPYSAPSGALQENVVTEAAPALWNPGAAASWSLLFSPVLGAWLQMRNWQALGEAKNAQVSWYWCIASAVLIVLLVGASLALPDAHPFQKLSNRSGFILLIAWYFSHGKLQIAYVKERFGKDYPRKGWAAPLGIAFAAMIAFLVALVLLSVALSMAGVIQLPQ